MKAIYVFKTTVGSARDMNKLSPLLNGLLRPEGEWNFDLEDCDRILRVESPEFVANAVNKLLIAWGYHCEELLD